jgi:outer membrane lipoprotein-sorting protein
MRVSRAVALGLLLTAALPQSLDTEQLVEELRASLDSFEAVSADIRQRAAYAQLAGDVELTGTLFFQRPDRFRLELQGVQNLRVQSDGDSVWLVDLDLEEVEEWDLDDAVSLELTRLFPLLGVFTPDDMLRDFVVSSVAAQRAEHRLELVPRAPAHAMERMAIELDGRFRPRWARVEYGNGDTLELEFDGWRRRDPVSLFFFRDNR